MSTVNTVRMLSALIVLCPDQPHLGPPLQLPLPWVSDRASQMDLRFTLSPCLQSCLQSHLLSHLLLPLDGPGPGSSPLWCLGLLTDAATSPWLCWPCLWAACESASWLVRALPVLKSPLAAGSSSFGEQPHWHCSLTNRTEVYWNCSKTNLG